MPPNVDAIDAALLPLHAALKPMLTNHAPGTVFLGLEQCEGLALGVGGEEEVTGKSVLL